MQWLLLAAGLAVCYCMRASNQSCEDIATVANIAMSTKAAKNSVELLFVQAVQPAHNE